MGYRTATYLEFKNIFSDWNVKKTTGGNVADVALSMANRAQLKLWQYRDWDALKRLLTLSGDNALDSDNEFILPANFGRMYRAFYDTNDDTLPDGYFYLQDGDQTRRYEIRTTFTKADGYVRTIKFGCAPTEIPILRYIIELEALATDADILFFPLELMVKQAQVLRLTDKGISGSEYEVVKKELRAELSDFTGANFTRNTNTVLTLKDSAGKPIIIDDTSLDGADTGSNTRSSRDRDNSRRYT